VSDRMVGATDGRAGPRRRYKPTDFHAGLGGGSGSASSPLGSAAGSSPRSPSTDGGPQATVPTYPSPPSVSSSSPDLAAARSAFGAPFAPAPYRGPAAAPAGAPQARLPKPQPPLAWETALPRLAPAADAAAAASASLQQQQQPWLAKQLKAAAATAAPLSWQASELDRNTTGTPHSAATTLTATPPEAQGGVARWGGVPVHQQQAGVPGVGRRAAAPVLQPVYGNADNDSGDDEEDDVASDDLDAAATRKPVPAAVGAVGAWASQARQRYY
jgi:hypothetical protein